MSGVSKRFRISWPSFFLGAAAGVLLLLIGLALVGYEVNRRLAIEVKAAEAKARAMEAAAQEARAESEKHYAEAVKALAEMDKRDVK